MEAFTLHWLECTLKLSGKTDSFFDWVWADIAVFGVQGIDEGTVLSEDLFGPEGPDVVWPLDSGNAPEDRDWVSNQAHSTVKIFFETEEGAKNALNLIRKKWNIEAVYCSEKNQDWDAEWKKSFQGVSVPPNWFIRPPHRDLNEVEKLFPRSKIITVNPGAGFGTGTHETTQLILKILAEDLDVKSLLQNENSQALDFGSGSGVLSIAACICGAEQTDAVEIDPLANLNAIENIRLNDLSEKINVSEQLQSKQYDLVIANILRPVLVEFAPELISRLKPKGVLLLSGLLEKDLPAVCTAYSLLGQPKSFQNGDWWALKFIKNLDSE